MGGNKTRLTLAVVFLGMFLTGSGCMHDSLSLKGADRSADVKHPSTTQPITADQITAQNAHSQAQALRDEMEKER